jgi:hypothetical protein
MTMLFAALYEMRAIRTKQEAVAFIQAQGWFDLRPGDWKPYDTQTEPRWHSMIAWARLACVHREFMFPHDENDHWEITRKGLEKIERLRGRFASGELDVRRCYYWSRKFKKWMTPSYEPSDNDHRRPEDRQEYV